MKKFFCLILLLLSTINCGYTTRSELIDQYRTIRVEPIKNNVDFTQENRSSFYYPLMEIKIRDAVVDRFMFDGNLRIAKDDTADLVMTAELMDYNRSVLRYADNDDVEESRVQVVVDVSVKDVQADKEILKKRIIGEATYFLTGTLATSERSAVDAAVEDVAKRMVEAIVQYW